MKKRIEKVVERTKSSGKYLTYLKKYNIHSESGDYYFIIDDLGRLSNWLKLGFKVVSEREVLEFEGDQVYNRGDFYNISVWSDIDLRNHNIKVIATPKDKTYEEMSKEELIELLKAKE